MEKVDQSERILEIDDPHEKEATEIMLHEKGETKVTDRNGLEIDLVRGRSDRRMNSGNKRFKYGISCGLILTAKHLLFLYVMDGLIILNYNIALSSHGSIL